MTVSTLKLMCNIFITFSEFILSLSITRLENTNRKLAELNQLSEQKFKRVQKSFVNAASMLQKMQGDLGFIHGAIKKLTHLSALEKSVVV